MTGVKEAVTYIEMAISSYSDEVSSIENGKQAGRVNTLCKVALTHLKEVPDEVSKEAIATALCGAAGSVGSDWRDKKMVRIEGSKDRIVDAIYALQLTAQQTTIPIPTVEELAEAMYQNNTALLTNVEARYIAKVVHKLLTKGRGGI
jgi:hypothetical protein